MFYSSGPPNLSNYSYICRQGSYLDFIAHEIVLDLPRSVHLIFI